MSDFNYLNLVSLEQHLVRSVRAGQPTGQRFFAPDAPTPPIRRTRPTRRDRDQHLVWRLRHLRLGRA
ncbi:MAG TPA: hypothetical protein VMM13_03925 [Euzebya sp.]|nr:hypothetical protein [Euzebya sp.]